MQHFKSCRKLRNVGRKNLEIPIELAADLKQFHWKGQFSELNFSAAEYKLSRLRITPRIRVESYSSAWRPSAFLRRESARAFDAKEH
jgi:hypothetical protein